MPTDNPRPDKVAVVDEVRERLSNTEAVVLTEYRGLDVPAMSELRSAIREAGGEYKIYKNTLVRFAVQELGLDIEDLLAGPTAIAFVAERPDGSAGDAASLAKALRDFAKSNDNLVIKGGVLDQRTIGLDEISALADLPSRDQLFAEFAGAMESMYQDFAGLLDAKLREFAYALQEFLDKGGPSADASAETEDAAAAASEETDAGADEAAAEGAGDDAGTETDAAADEAAAEDTAEASADAEEADAEAAAPADEDAETGDETGEEA